MDDSPLVFVERWTAQLRALQDSVQSKTVEVATLSATVQVLSKGLTSRAADLPAFELGRCERELKALQDSVAAAKTASAPKSKFSFKRAAPAAPPAQAPASAQTPSASTPLSAPPASRPNASPVPPTALALSNLSFAHLTPSSFPSVPTSGQALALTALTSCLVDLRAAAPFSALYLTDLARCIVLLPPGRGGSALLQRCEGCVIALGAHQFRMHDSQRCAVLLDAGSTPVIERCSKLTFGAYPASLGPEQPLAQDPAAPPQVQDFDDPFATPSRPSRNWRALGHRDDGTVAAELGRLDAGLAWEDMRDRVLDLAGAGIGWGA